MSSSSQRKAPWDRSTKYWCRYCGIFVHDNKSSRKMHEQGSKHKENVQKYLRAIDKQTAESERAESELQLQLAAIDAQANAKYAAEDLAQTQEPEPAQRDQQPAIADEPAIAAEPVPADRTADQPSKPVDVGIVGTWEVVEEEEEGTKKGGTDNGSAEGRQLTRQARPRSEHNAGSRDLHGSEWLDEEDDPAQLDDFKLVEKTHARDNDDAAAEPAAMFKKRRVAGNRSSRKTRKTS